jgi:hypothetical protein
MIRPNIVSRSKFIVEQHFSLTEQRLKVLAKTLNCWTPFVYSLGDFDLPSWVLCAAGRAHHDGRSDGGSNGGLTRGAGLHFK